MGTSKDGKYVTALDQLKLHWAAGDYTKALKLAASWYQLGSHKVDIQRGWAAHQNHDTYADMGKDPDALVTAGIQAVADRYGLTIPTVHCWRSTDG